MAILKPKARKCPICSAPLEVPDTGDEVRCTYCHGAVHIERARPPADERAQLPRTVYVGKATWAHRVILPAVLLVILLPVVAVGLVFAFGFSFLRPSKLPGLPPVTAVPPEGLPRVCERETLTLTDLRHEGPGPLIVAGRGCRLTLERVDLRSDVVLKVAHGAEVQVVDSTLRGTRAAVELESSGRFKASGSTTLAGDQHGIVGDSNAQVDLDGVKVQGGEAGIFLGANARLTLLGGRVEGKRAGIEAGNNARMSIRQTEVAGGRAGLKFANNLELVAQGARVQGAQKGLEAGHNAKVRLGPDTHIASPEVAVEFQRNAVLELDGATAEGGDTGLWAGSNTAVELVSGKIAGGKVALKGDTSAALTMRGGEIRSAGTALALATQADVVLRGGTVAGGAFALYLEGPPRRLELEGAEVQGAQVRDGRRSRAR